MKVRSLSILLTALLCGFWSAWSQTVLSAGDIAIIGINTGGTGDDAIKLVTLVELNCNTTFVVTDNNRSSGAWPCGSGDSEFAVRVTVTERVLAGSVFYLDIESGADIGKSTVSTGSMTVTNLGGVWGNNFGLNSGGDNVHVLQGNPDERNNPVFIFSLKHGSSYANSTTCTGGGAVNNTGLPAGLTLGTTALVISSGQDQWHYNCGSALTSGTRAALLSAISNASNWTTNASQLIWDNTTCFFDVTDQWPVDGMLGVSGAGCGCLSGCNLSGMGGPNCGSGTSGNCSAGYQSMSLDISVPAGCTYTVLATMRNWNSCTASGADGSGSCPSCDRLKVDISGGSKAYQSGASNQTLNDSYSLAGPGTITISGNANRADEIIVYRILANDGGTPCEACMNFLPVELLAFSATEDQHAVVLNWSTASETGSSYFLIEKSVNGYDWEPLTSVTAMGYSTSLMEYHVYDSSPFSGTSYYRLTEVDLDGSTRFTQVRSVYFAGDRKYVKTYNLLGEEVGEGYHGVVILLYENGTSERVYR